MRGACADRGACPDAAAPDGTSSDLKIESGLRITLSVAKPEGDHETFIDVASLGEEGFDLRARWPSLKKTATRRMLWDDMARAPYFALNMTRAERDRQGHGIWHLLRLWQCRARGRFGIRARRNCRGDAHASGWRLQVVGHTDGIGDATANLELSRSRAAAICSALIERAGAAAADRLDTAGFGEARPRADNETLEGRAATRRVELIRHSAQEPARIPGDTRDPAQEEHTRKETQYARALLLAPPLLWSAALAACGSGPRSGASGDAGAAAGLIWVARQGTGMFGQDTLIAIDRYGRQDRSADEPRRRDVPDRR